MGKMDSEERAILEAFDQGQLVQAKSRDQLLAEHRQIAANSMKKDASINIRLSSRDLRALQAQAMREGIPYQTLVASLLHKFVAGTLIDKTSTH
jgi:predicted DNA binding CopG/RHH family protein